MKKNVFMKVFFSSVVWTAACMGLAAYAANKAQQKDPAILEKLTEKVQTNSNVHISFRGHDNTQDYTIAEDSWSFPTPSVTISITTIDGNVEVVQGSAGSGLNITAKGRRRNSRTKLLDTTGTPDKVTIAQPEGDTTQGLHVRVSIPADFKGDLDLTTVSGDTRLTDLALKSLKVRSVSGDLRVSGVAAESVEQETVSGDVSLENRINGNMKLQSVSGDFDLHLPKADRSAFQIESFSGKVQNAWSGPTPGNYKVSVKSTSGDIKVSR